MNQFMDYKDKFMDGFKFQAMRSSLKKRQNAKEDLLSQVRPTILQRPTQLCYRRARNQDFRLTKEVARKMIKLVGLVQESSFRITLFIKYS